MPTALPAPGRARWAVLLALACQAAGAQDPVDRPVLKGVGPVGTQATLTESWGTLGFTLTNPTDRDVEARVLTFYADAPGRQFGRDVRVPARSVLRSWSCIGPPSASPGRDVVELKSLLYDRTGGREVLLRSPEGPPLYSHMVRFRRKEPATVVLLDADVADGSREQPSPGERARAEDVRELVRAFRHHALLSDRVNAVPQRFLPPAAEALDGVDHVVLGTDRLADDPAGRRTLREWLERGGTLWVMLDSVGPATLGPLLGDVADVQVVDRVSLTRVQFRNGPMNAHRAEVPAVEYEEPVEFVRVLTAGPQVHYTVDGWPAAFVKDVGRGRVVFTALAARGWFRERTAKDPKSRYPEFPKLPMPLVPFEFLAAELHPGPDRPPLPEDDLRAAAVGEIGYAVTGRGRVVAVFGGLFVALAAAAVALGRWGKREHLGWIGPGLALGAAGVFVALGLASRGAVPPTVAEAQVVDAVPGLDEAQAAGVLAVYHPAASTAPVGAERGGAFDLDLSGLEGRVQRRVQTDLDRWHWDDLELPAGVRTAPFRQTVRTEIPVEAVVRFGPDGAEGRVTTGPFGRLEDVLLSAPGRHILAVAPAADGSFRVNSDAELHGGQLVVGTLLTDRQRARQALYEKLLAEPQPRHVANRGLLLGWAEPADLHFALGADGRKGEALVTIPLQYERTPPGTRVVVPAAFVDCVRTTADGRRFRPTTESQLAAANRLRFQIPASVRPLVVDGVRLTLHLSAPGREVVVGAVAGRETVVVRKLQSPVGVERIDIDPKLLLPDEDGAMTVSFAVGEAGERTVWRLESAGLELRGRTSEAP
jgi:hypothetical protein